MHAITCAACGKAANRHGSQALYCSPCANTKKPRLAAPDRRRAGQYTGLKIGGQWCCVDCRAPVEVSEFNGKKRRPPIRCMPCARLRYVERDAVKSRAASLVAKAVRLGELRRPSEFACVDCGRAACQYDHRDYTKPLDVVPVCRSCNVMRGPADVWVQADHASDSTKVAA